MDAKETYDAVWKADRMPAPDGNPSGTNANWTPTSVVTDTNKKVRLLTARMDGIEAQLAEVLELLKAKA